MRDKRLLPGVLLSVILCLAFAFQAMAQKAEIQGWDKFKWAMSPEQAKQVYFDYENITGEKMWEEEIRIERFCVLKTNSFYILENYFSPEITLYFFDNKLFEIVIRQKISHEATGLFVSQIEKSSTLADRLIKKYGTPVGLAHFSVWQRKGKKLLDKLQEIIRLDPLNLEQEKHYLSQLQGDDGFILSWQEEGKNELYFSVIYWVRLLEKPYFVRLCECHIEFMMRYVNISLRNKYEQERQKARDKIQIEFESF